MIVKLQSSDQLLPPARRVLHPILKWWNLSKRGRCSVCLVNLCNTSVRGEVCPIQQLVIEVKCWSTSRRLMQRDRSGRSRGVCRHWNNDSLFKPARREKDHPMTLQQSRTSGKCWTKLKASTTSMGTVPSSWTRKQARTRVNSTCSQ